MTTYEDELSGLPDVYTGALTSPDEKDLESARAFVAGSPVYAVGSGGAAPAARYAADLHNQVRSTPATVLSPLSFVQQADRLNLGTLFLFSARGKHPDTTFAARVALNRGFRIVLITQRRVDELDPIYNSPLVVVLTIPAPNGSDGFLATQSVLSMAVTAARLYGQDLPASSPVVDVESLPVLTGRLIVVSTVDEGAAAADIEVRLHELGLADVQLTDYRNLAHGRHVGLSRRREDTTVLFLVSPRSLAIAERTRAALPDDIRLAQLTTALDGAAGGLHLLLQAMHLPVELAAAQGVQPHRPKVPPFGRELYHLPFRRIFPSTPLDPVARKVRELGVPAGGDEREIFRDAYTQWRAHSMKADIKAVLLDYDGTCVETRYRWSLPTVAVRDALTALLNEGVIVAFASGRGKSLHRDLREWVDPKHWAKVWLGLHNGTLNLTLADELPTQQSDSILEGLRERLQPFETAGTIEVEISGDQMTLGSRKLSVSSLSALVATAATREPRFPVRVQASAHSVDVIPASKGKDAYLVEVRARVNGDVLVIGDQGNLGGNDFAMLASTTLSVSVDRCSTDPTRCWNVAAADKVGPDALVYTLGLVERRRSGIGFFPPALPREKPTNV